MAGLLSKGITLGVKNAGVKRYLHTIELDYPDTYPLILESERPEPFTSDSLTDTGSFVGCKIVEMESNNNYECNILNVKWEGKDLPEGGELLISCDNGVVHGIYGVKGIVKDTVTIASGNTEAFATLSNLQEIAELGNNAPEKIDVTVLSDGAKKSINGLADTAQDLTFKFLYDKEQFDMLANLTGSHEWRVSLPDGTTATFTATAAVKLAGVGVSAALTYSLILSVESEIVFA